MKKGFLLILSVLTVWAGGCAKVKMVQAQPVCIGAVSRDELMRVCEKTLISMQFQIAKYDVENGVIRTWPLRGGQFFEFWRSDNAGGFNAAESNLQSIQRTVELTFESRQSAICVQCAATTQRLSMPEKPIQGYYNAAALYTASDLSRQRLEVDEKTMKKMQWIDLGRDEALEQKILEKIQHRIEKGDR
jgi:hypothetical protein